MLCCQVLSVLWMNILEDYANKSLRQTSAPSRNVCNTNCHNSPPLSLSSALRVYIIHAVYGLHFVLVRSEHFWRVHFLFEFVHKLTRDYGLTAAAAAA